MFSYLRYFAVISFFVVIGASLLIGIYFKSVASEHLIQTTERSSISLAQSYINTTWQKHLPNLRRLRAVDTSLWKRYAEFQKFSEDTFRQFEGVPVTQLNIYTPEGVRVLTINQDAAIDYAEGNNINVLPPTDPIRLGFRDALTGTVQSNIIEDRTYKSRDGKTVKGTMVQSFVPIMPDSFVSVLANAKAPKIEGVIEVYYDITPQWSQLYLFQVLGTGGIMIIFMVLIGTLFFTSRKAETIITTQHETNVELAAAAAKAEAESRSKSQFLANVSHELRTPLNAIIGFSEIIKNEVMGALNNDQYMNYVKDIHSSGVHLLSLINDILDFSKAEAGKLELQLSELDATKLIKNCMRLVSPRAEEMGVTLTTEVPKEHFIITGDAKKLKQVLLNLLSNSVKFTPQGGEVKVSAWQNVMDDSIAIEVRDTGIGIAPKDISRAMSPFGQVDSALSRKYEGTGLGLPLTKKFVEIMGGTFKIESELNVGTTITITIPLSPPKHIMKAAAKGSDESDKPRAKQISPGLMPSSAVEVETYRRSTPPISENPSVLPANPILHTRPSLLVPPAIDGVPIQTPLPASAPTEPSPAAAPPPVRSLVAGMRAPEAAAPLAMPAPSQPIVSHAIPLPDASTAPAAINEAAQMEAEMPTAEAPIPELPSAETLQPAPPPAPTEVAGLKFTSYADLKRMGMIPDSTPEN